LHSIPAQHSTAQHSMQQWRCSTNHQHQAAQIRWSKRSAVAQSAVLLSALWAG
jgi:hypothetical protein